MQNARSRQLSMTLFFGEKRCLVLLVGENEVVVDWRSCIRRSKYSVYFILVWVHLARKRATNIVLPVCLILVLAARWLFCIPMWRIYTVINNAPKFGGG